MSREWNTGEMALVTFDNATGDQRARGISRVATKVALVDADHRGVNGAEPAEAWFVFGATSRIGATWECVRDTRPLVVIDPEDREAVERLQKRLIDSGAFTGLTGGSISKIQAALDEFANPTPPRPDEPTDPAVRVVDRDGDLWARIGDTWVNNQGGKSQSWDYVVEHYSPLGVQP